MTTNGKTRIEAHSNDTIACDGAVADRQHACIVGAINCAPANKSLQEYMRPFRVQAPEIRKRLERGVEEGDVPEDVDLEPLISLYAGLIYGLPVRARDGASRKALLAGVTGAMAAWDS